MYKRQKQRTVKLPDNCGTISLTPGTDESVFYTISLNALKDVYKRQEVSSTRVTLEDDDQTMNVFYGKNFDSDTGQVVEGEFKDVLIKK